MTDLPTVFVSHGAPTLALDPGETGRRLAALAGELPRPAAILVVSAHWDTAAPRVSGVARQRAIHDFHGFPEALYRLDYPAPGAPQLACRVQALLAESGIAAGIDAQRGLDHGAWVPLRMMYPDAAVPVTQLSLQSRLGPAHHYRLGRALSVLRHEGVLIMGSGSFTHNLGEFGRHAADGPPASYVREFREWVRAELEAGDLDRLFDYREHAPHAVRAHPTEEHLLPLFVALGAAGAQPKVRHIHDGVTYGILAMDIFAFGGDTVTVPASATAGAVAV